MGNDPRGVMFGVGKLLRVLDWRTGAISLRSDFRPTWPPTGDPRTPGRLSADGQQLGRVDRRPVRAVLPRLVIFGANSVENIPFEEASDLMKYSRREMNLKLSELCDKYDIDHWVWVPVEFQLPNPKKSARVLCTAGGILQDGAAARRRLHSRRRPGRQRDGQADALRREDGRLLHKYHPHAKIWISLQRPQPGDTDLLFPVSGREEADWFGGAVMGPSGPSMELYRRRLPAEYKLRWYPDITHIVRGQYPIPWLDPAWGVTLGREPVNPRPVDYAAIYRNDYRFTDGFLSYSDGIHDDFNKNLWTQLGWEPDRPVREIAAEYARFFFRPGRRPGGGRGCLALETDLRGSMADNGSIDGTLRQWQEIEQKLSGTETNWRFDMHLFRAYYDGYTRHRLLYEANLEKRALQVR